MSKGIAVGCCNFFTRALISLHDLSSLPLPSASPVFLSSVNFCVQKPRKLSSLLWLLLWLLWLLLGEIKIKWQLCLSLEKKGITGRGGKQNMCYVVMAEEESTQQSITLLHVFELLLLKYLFLKTEEGLGWPTHWSCQPQGGFVPKLVSEQRREQNYPWSSAWSKLWNKCKVKYLKISKGRWKGFSKTSTRVGGGLYYPRFPWEFAQSTIWR